MLKTSNKDSQKTSQKDLNSDLKNDVKKEAKKSKNSVEKENQNKLESKVKNTSLSSIETQRDIRIEKIKELKSKNINPFTPYSYRDYELGFVKFWFDFVHRFDFSKIDENDKSVFTLHFFLEQVLFPQSLVEKMEEKIQIRHTVREMGLDPDMDSSSIENEFSSEVVDEAKQLIPLIGYFKEEKRLKYLQDLLMIDDFLEDFSMEEEEGYSLAFEPNQYMTLAGRIKSKRVSGKIAFATVEDESIPEGFQFIFRKDQILTEPYKKEKNISLVYEDALSFEDLKKLIDEGDYIQATGKLDYSQRGEPSLFVEKFRILTKSVRPLPEKLEYQNVEERYLNKVVDYKMNTKDENGLSSRDIVALKSKYWEIWREEMQKADFLEVECPIFEETPGGADAKPFTTFYNELNEERYLRISLELPLKKLIAGGFERVFEIGRIFRNEGASPQHLQEYTQIEWYWAYTDYKDAMEFISRVYRRIASEIIGSLIQTDYYGKQINWGEWCSEEMAQRNGWEMVNGWPAIKYFEAIKYYSKNFYEKGELDLEGKNKEELFEIAKKHNIEVENSLSYGNLLDKIYKKVARPFIQDPIFLYHQPVELEPLAKRDPQDPKFVHRWQVVAGTAELGKAFSELNDPVDQYDRFKEQQKARDEGDEEAQFMDEKYVEALELGLPPLSGFGVSERLMSFMLGKNIKECVTFPAVRSQEKANVKTMVAHIVILDIPKIPLWSKMNATAHLSASLAAREGKQMIEIDSTKTVDGEVIPMNTRHAIVMKKTDKKENLIKLKKLAEAKKLTVTCFTEEMRDSSNDIKVKENQEQKSNSQIGYLGILVYGEIKEVEKLTEKFGLVE
jgi:lysyl-tRNA synthetase, class II